MKNIKSLSAEAYAVILSIIIVVAGVGATYGITQHQIDKHDDQIQKMEEQYKKDHDILLEIKRDVHWIRGAVESTR